ncbi:hypothetical protein, partial [Klebsiella pneumoniae]|uniref:hypothetical protein n=1 Tax=Klebsiella pneumoniae TaxID=573 RepID=UPI001952BBD0
RKGGNYVAAGNDSWKNVNSPIGYIPYNESHRPTDNGVNLNESVERDIRKHALHKGRNDYGNKNTNRYLVPRPQEEIQPRFAEALHQDL